MIHRCGNWETFGKHRATESAAHSCSSATPWRSPQSARLVPGQSDFPSASPPATVTSTNPERDGSLAVFQVPCSFRHDQAKSAERFASFLRHLRNRAIPSPLADPNFRARNPPPPVRTEDAVQQLARRLFRRWRTGPELPSRFFASRGGTLEVFFSSSRPSAVRTVRFFQATYADGC